MAVAADRIERQLDRFLAQLLGHLGDTFLEEPRGPRRPPRLGPHEHEVVLEPRECRGQSVERLAGRRRPRRGGSGQVSTSD
jgi:hypothetical protein